MQLLNVHLRAPFRLCREALPALKPGSAIVNVASTVAILGGLRAGAYAAAKAGIIGFTKTAAKELAAFGVTVNAVSPNAATRMTASIPADKIAELTGPISRFAAPTEIASAICFLASEEAGYVTGAVLPVDGGVSI